MSKSTSNLCKLLALLCSIAAIVALVIIYREKIAVLLSDVKDKFNQKRLKIDEPCEFDDFVDM